MKKYSKKKLVFIILFICIFLGASLLIKKISHENYYTKIDLVDNEDMKNSFSKGMYFEFSIKDIFSDKYWKYDNLFTLYFNNVQILNDKDLNVIMDKFVIINDEINPNTTDEISSNKDNIYDKDHTIYLSFKYYTDKSKLFFRIYIPNFLIQTNSSFKLKSDIKDLNISDINRISISKEIEEKDPILENNLRLVSYYIKELHMSYRNIFFAKRYFDRLIDYLIENKLDILVVFNKRDIFKLRDSLNTILDEIIDNLNFEVLRQLHLDNYKEALGIYEDLLSFYKKIFSVRVVWIQEELNNIKNSI